MIILAVVCGLLLIGELVLCKRIEKLEDEMNNIFNGKAKKH